MDLIKKEYKNFNLYRRIEKYADSENMAKRIFNALYRIEIKDEDTFYNKYGNNVGDLQYIRNIGRMSVNVLENVLKDIHNNR